MATVAPAWPKRTAVARPMPRLPPVTRTTWSAKPSAMEGAEQGVHAVQIFSIVDHRPGEDLLDQPGQRPPRPHLDEGVGAQLLQALDRLGPANWAGQLADHEPADVVGLRMDLGIRVEDLGPAELAQRDLFPGRGKHLGGLRHQRRMEGPAHWQGDQALGPGRLQLLAHGAQARLATGDDDLARGIVIGDDHEAVAGGADALP